MITLWGRRSSANVQKVLWALGELALQFDRKTVGGAFGGTRDEAYLRINPNALVPALQDGDVTMFEIECHRALSRGTLSPRRVAARRMATACSRRAVDGLAAEQPCRTRRQHLHEHRAQRSTAGEPGGSGGRTGCDQPGFRNCRRPSCIKRLVCRLGIFVRRYRRRRLPVALPRHGLQLFADFAHLSRWFASATDRAAFKAHVELPVARTLEEWTQIERQLA